jgi:hypothetical protein
MDTLQQILDDAGVEYKLPGQHHHATSSRIQVDCPWCSPHSHKFRMGLTTSSANCWVCGPHRIATSLAAIIHRPVSECSKSLGELKPIREPEIDINKSLKLPDRVSDLEVAHRLYLKSRGLNPKQITMDWSIRGIGISAELPWRIFIPVYFDGELVSWTTRAIGNTPGSKYISARPTEEKYALKKLLYGEDYTEHKVIVVEGPVDVWKIGKGAVAICGSVPTQSQLYRIAKFPVRYICFDSEREAQRNAKKLCEELSLFPGETHRIELNAKDPGSADNRELDQLKSLLK